MGTIVYGLCALTSLACELILVAGYPKTREKHLLCNTDC